MRSDDFLDDKFSGNHDQREEWLSRYSGFCTPLQLAYMIDEFPLLEDWKGGRWDTLLRRACAAIEARERQRRPLLRPNSPAKPAPVAAERVADSVCSAPTQGDLRAANELLEARALIKSLERENADLRAEIEGLRIENMRLKNRIGSRRMARA